jgi:hypothetical protein
VIKSIHVALQNKHKKVNILAHSKCNLGEMGDTKVMREVSCSFKGMPSRKESKI